MERVSLLTPQDVRDAAAHLCGKVQKTPVYGSPPLSKLASRLGSITLKEPSVNIRLVFKCESMQATGSFKFRGATNFMLNLRDENLKLGVVTYSTGTLPRNFLNIRHTYPVIRKSWGSYCMCGQDVVGREGIPRSLYRRHAKVCCRV